MSCDGLADLLGAYALDAVDPEEAAAVEEHLRECERCAEEVAAHRDTAWRLANSGGEAPPELWERIAERIASPPNGRREPPFTPVLVGRPVQQTAKGLQRAASPSERAGRRLGQRVVAAAVAAAAAVAIALLGVRVAHLDHEVSQLNAAARASGGFEGAAAALTNPAAIHLSLHSTSPGGGTVGELVVLPSGSAYLVNGRLPALPSSKTYQLWSVARGRAISVGLLGSHPSTVAFTLSPDQKEDELLITEEPAGGVVAPTSPPVAQARL